MIVKHLVYAEDVLYELMQHPDNAIYKYSIKQLIDKVVEEKEVRIGMFMPAADWEADGDLYD